MTRHRHAAILAALASAAAAPAAQDVITMTFPIAAFNDPYLGYLPPGSPVIGHDVVAARVFINVYAHPGSDAAFFATEFIFPIDPAPGKSDTLTLTGADMGWTGWGTFLFTATAPSLRGVGVQGFFGGASYADGGFVIAEVLPNSRVELDFAIVPAPGPAVLFLAAAPLLTTRRRPRA